MSLVTTTNGDELLEFHPGDRLDLPEAEQSIPMPLALVAAQYEGKILLVFNTWRNQWELPGGMIEENEPPIEAAKRELLEESGQSVTDLQMAGWVKFCLQPDHRLELAVLYRCELETLQPFAPNDETSAILLWDVNDAAQADINAIDAYLAACAY